MDSLLLTCDHSPINKNLLDFFAITINELPKKIESDELSTFLKAIIIPIISATLGAFSAFIFNRLNWNMQNKIANKTKSCEEIIEIIGILEADSQDYWSQRRGYKNNTEFQLKERKIIHSLMLLNKYIDILNKMQTNKPLYQFWKNEVRFPHGETLFNLHNALYDEITGGSFQTKYRDKDLDKIFNISKKCMEAKSTLSEIIYLQK